MKKLVLGGSGFLGDEVVKRVLSHGAKIVCLARNEGNLIKLHQKYPEIEFAILGAFYHGNPGSIKEKQIARWEEEGIVNYLGVSDNVQLIIDKADCVVLPSYREGLSRVLLEGACMAKPIVTTNVPGCKDVVDDGINGYLCKVKDVNSLALQMEKILLLSEDERKEMGKRGREKVIAQFDEKIVIEKYKKAIAQLLL